MIAEFEAVKTAVRLIQASVPKLTWCRQMSNLSLDRTLRRSPPIATYDKWAAGVGDARLPCRGIGDRRRPRSANRCRTWLLAGLVGQRRLRPP